MKHPSTDTLHPAILVGTGGSHLLFIVTENNKPDLEFPLRSFHVFIYHVREAGSAFRTSFGAHGLGTTLGFENLTS